MEVDDNRRQLFAAYEEAKRLAQAGELARQSAIAGVPLPSADASHKKKLFSEVPRIEGDRIVLDRVVDSDADALSDLIDDPAVQRYLPTYLFEKQFSDVHEAIELFYGDLFQSGESLILASRLKETGEMTGLAEFYGLRDELHKVSVGGRLRERYWNSGIGSEMVRLMVGYLYGETDIQIITASVMVENTASAHMLEKNGFIRTACGVEEDWGFDAPVVVDKFFC